MARISKAYLERRTANLEGLMKRKSIHPGEAYRLTLDYIPEYGGYKMEFEETDSPYGTHTYFLTGQRLKASEMESYQQGLFDALQALQ